MFSVLSVMQREGIRKQGAPERIFPGLTSILMAPASRSARVMPLRQGSIELVTLRNEGFLYQPPSFAQQSSH